MTLVLVLVLGLVLVSSWVDSGIGMGLVLSGVGCGRGGVCARRSGRG